MRLSALVSPCLRAHVAQVSDSEPTTTMITDANKLTLEQAVGQLLCPLMKGVDYDQQMRWQENENYGAVFFNSRTQQEFVNASTALNSAAVSPVLIAADLEHGATAIADKSTPFPWSMALAATDSEELAYSMGQATAVEARHAGIHWTFSPNIDINYNFRAPESNIRTYGDDPTRIKRLALSYIRGIQEGQLVAAAAKHFPGTGIDERDQHLLTAINPLTVEAWMSTYGEVWRAVIDAGVLSIMSGHISFPAWQGIKNDVLDALPATLCPKLQIDLLREELGFKGVLVSDAAPMIGITSRVPEDEAVVEFIKAGGDSYLFARPEVDYPILLKAVQDGRLSEDRIYQSAQRMLDLKKTLRLDEKNFSPQPTAAQTQEFTHSAKEIAQKSITVVKDNGKVGQPIPKGAKVLTVTLDYKDHKFAPVELDAFDERLREAGCDVTHWHNPAENFWNDETGNLPSDAGNYDVVFINFHIVPHMELGHTRLYGARAMTFWHGFYTSHPDVRFTSFGTPYILFDQPHLPNMMLAYGGLEDSQRAAVDVWLGSQTATGKCPVKLPTHSILDRVPEFSSL